MGKLCHLWPSIHRGRGMSKFRRSSGDGVWVSFVICGRRSGGVEYG